MQDMTRVSQSLIEMETELKKVWGRYVKHLSQSGPLGRSTVELRQKYFDLYGRYKKQKEWNQTFNPNQGGTA